LRYQPDSALSIWFRERVGNLKGRPRRIAIVAMARKLLVALWRYLETGVIPTGAVLKGLNPSSKERQQPQTTQEEYSYPRWMCDRARAWLKHASDQDWSHSPWSPFALANTHEGAWYGENPDRI